MAHPLRFRQRRLARVAHTVPIAVLQLACIVVVSSLTAFASPPETSVRLDFSTALQQILSRSTDVSLQTAALDQLKAKNLPTRLHFLPTFELSYQHPVSDPESFLAPTKQIAMTSQWNLFRFGADWMNVTSANSSQNSQESVISATILKVEEDAVTALVNEIRRAQEVKVHRLIVANREHLMTIAQQRYKKGVLAFQESEKLNIDLENSKANLINAEMTEVEARTQLEQLLGHSQIELEWPWIAALTQERAKKITEQELTLQRRPDWLAAQFQVDSDTALLSRSWRLMLPSVNAEFSYGNYSNFFGSMTGWTGVLTVNLTIFDQLTQVSEIRNQIATRKGDEARLEQTQRKAHAEWGQARVNFQKALESALVRARTLVRSRAIYRDNLLRFQAGRISVNDLTIDQERMYDAELLSIQGWGDAHLQYTLLCHSLGQRVNFDQTAP